MKDISKLKKTVKVLENELNFFKKMSAETTTKGILSKHLLSNGITYTNKKIADIAIKSYRVLVDLKMDKKKFFITKIKK